MRNAERLEPPASGLKRACPRRPGVVLGLDAVGVAPTLAAAPAWLSRPCGPMRAGQHGPQAHPVYARRMLRAVLRRKTGQSGLHRAIDPDDDSVQPEAADPRSYEDPLTAAVFERLSYLDDTCAWRLMFQRSKVIAGAAVPHLPTDALSYEFWPRWRLGASLVEPDVAIRASRSLVLVEAKHRTPQHMGQWERELQAARELEPAADGIWLLAVGGEVPRGDAAELIRDGVRGVLHLRWRHLGHEARVVARSARGHRLRLLDDLGAALAHFGYQRRSRFGDLHTHRTRTIEPSLPPWTGTQASDVSDLFAGLKGRTHVVLASPVPRWS